jgi:hypothetical protein
VKRAILKYIANRWMKKEFATAYNLGYRDAILDGIDQLVGLGLDTFK